MTNAQSQILVAESIGMANFEQGLMRSPSQSAELMCMLKGREIGKTPKGEASTLDLMNAWSKGWDKSKSINS